MSRILVGAALAASFMAGPAEAATLVIDVAGIELFGVLDDPANMVLSYNLGAGALITGVSWDFTITAFSPSWLSEFGIDIVNSDFGGIGLWPSETNFSGTESVSGHGDLVSLGLSFSTLADGLLWVQFFDEFDDATVSPDGIFESGFLTISYEPGSYVPGLVPEPATWAMMIAGFGLVGVGARRRRTTVAA